MVLFVALMTFCAEILVLLVLFDNTPSVKELQVGCARHHGIASVSNSVGVNQAAVVCKDGKVWFPKR